MSSSLKETFGVMVYQEDVPSKFAHHFAGLDLSDADISAKSYEWKASIKAGV
ncbi:MAG: hypothetical protein MZV63_42160 [Marinilabiliales bacterium]|nr:hypothetical protein [Marinilabiliales bacterium]